MNEVTMLHADIWEKNILVRKNKTLMQGFGWYVQRAVWKSVWLKSSEWFTEVVVRELGKEINDITELQWPGTPC